jgi:hypothetical protein
MFSCGIEIRAFCGWWVSHQDHSSTFLPLDFYQRHDSATSRITAIPFWWHKSINSFNLTGHKIYRGPYRDVLYPQLSLPSYSITGISSIAFILRFWSNLFY